VQDVAELAEPELVRQRTRRAVGSDLVVLDALAAAMSVTSRARVAPRGDDPVAPEALRRLALLLGGPGLEVPDPAPEAFHVAAGLDEVLFDREAQLVRRRRGHRRQRPDEPPLGAPQVGELVGTHVLEWVVLHDVADRMAVVAHLGPFG